MRIASIDIGTNTILMLIADVENDGRLSIITDEHSIARLGKGVDGKGHIQQDTFNNVLEILKRFKRIADSHKVQSIVACGTSALREAKNQKEFIDFIHNQLSIEIKVLTGEQEARLTYLGAISDYLLTNPEIECTVLDIGGGSTEFVVGSGTGIKSASSIDIGSVRLTERVLQKSPPDDSSISNAIQIIHGHLQTVPRFSQTAAFIGVAGTLTTLASLDLRLAKYDPASINRHVLKIETIENIFQEIRPLTLTQLKSYSQIHPLRADIILAGILILREIMKEFSLSQITVSDRGLRYGILIDSLKTY